MKLTLRHHTRIQSQLFPPVKTARPHRGARVSVSERAALLLSSNVPSIFNLDQDFTLSRLRNRDLSDGKDVNGTLLEDLNGLLS